MWQEVWTEIAPEVVKLVVALALALVAAARAGLIELAKAKAKEAKAKTTKEQRSTALAIIGSAVGAVEQLYRNGVIKKPRKLEEAFERARVGLREAGLEFSDQQINDMIEDTVNTMNDMKDAFMEELNGPEQNDEEGNLPTPS